MDEVEPLAADFLRRIHINSFATSTDFAFLAEEIHRHNQSVNLTGAKTARDILRDHIFDSLLLIPVAQRFGVCRRMFWIDVGAGGGLPGLPLALALPDIHFTLIDSIGKKCHAMQKIIATLNLANAVVKCDRAETLGRHPEWREAFDWATARALGPLAVQVELALPFLRIGGRLLLQKGPDARDEIEKGTGILRQVGADLEDVQLVEASGFLGPRLVATILKVAKTPERYPRRPGIPEKRPLS